MTEYIKLKDAIRAMAQYLMEIGQWKSDIATSVMSKVKAADVVEVVRCKDCKYLDKGENDSESWCECTAHFGKYFDVDENGFCSYGKREDT